MEMNGTHDGVEGKAALTTSQSAYIEWLLEKDAWYGL